MTFDDYQKKARTTMLPSANNIPYIALGLASESGELAGKIKKWIRDQDSDMNKLDKKGLASELGDALWYTAMMADFLGYSLDEIAQMNVGKLAKRKKQNKLTGSGDNR